MKNDKLKFFNYIIYIFYILSTIYFISNKNYEGIGLSIFSIIVTFSTYKIYKLDLKTVDTSLYIIVNLFILSSFVLGSSYKFYDKIKYYDDFLHFWSGFISIKIGWNLLYKIKVNPKNNLYIFFIILFLFSMGISAICEIVEFSLDTLFGMKTQAGGLKDTMQDMMDSLLGGTIMVIYYNNKIKNKN